MVFIDFFNARAKVLFKCCPSLQRTLKVSKYSGLHRPLKIMQVLLVVVVLVFFIRFGSKMGRPILFIGFGTRGARGACAPHFPTSHTTPLLRRNAPSCSLHSHYAPPPISKLLQSLCCLTQSVRPSDLRHRAFHRSTKSV